MDEIGTIILGGAFIWLIFYGFYLLIIKPGFLPLFIFGGLFLAIAIRVVVDVKREFFEYKNDRQWFWPAYFDVLSRIRELFDRPRIWLIPEIIRESSKQTSRANDLYREIKNVLLHTPVSEAKKISFDHQSSQILFNINRALWKQSRSKYLYSAIKHDTSQAQQSKKEIESMINRLNQEVERSLDVLTAVSVSLLNVELAHGDAEFDRLLNELNESNRRLRELSDAYKDSKAV